MIGLTPQGLKFESRATLKEASDLLKKISELWPSLPKQNAIEIDLSALKDLDSSLIAILLECEKRAHAEARHIELISAPENLKNLAKVYDLSSWIKGMSA